ncbi:MULTISPECIES: phosphatase PAP2 family protein [Neobacillus]|uniref:Phosphatase PAP2 family protein n=1 Tax=Neobacillus rhizophilus TaxID=2833579 RepID=A0A942U2X5_9BACI|nr:MULTISPECIES: phosphatase PAP2 family protein [Neobacillus]MBS4211307.1 phosphatase PAP2 family protein [Neobacillus rhizophilus]
MDREIFRIINKLAGRYRFLDMIMIIISKKARYVYVLLLVILWFRNKNYKKLTLLTGVSVGVTYIFTFIINIINYKPRPFLNHEVNVLPPVPSKKDSSFLSRHTILAFAAANSVLLYHRLFGKIMWYLGIFIGISRIWMGHHYPIEIIRSALFGSITSFIVHISKKHWDPIISRIIYSYNRYCSYCKLR